MAVVISRSSAKSSSPNLLASPTRQQAANRRDWRNRHSRVNSKLVHLAESTSHQAWLEASLKKREADAASDVPKYVPFLAKCRELTPEGEAEHQEWIDKQLANAIRVRGGAACQKSGYKLEPHCTRPMPKSHRSRWFPHRLAFCRVPLWSLRH